MKVAIAEKTDQQANRKNRGSRGGRPVDLDAEDYKNRNDVERVFNKLKNWRGLADYQRSVIELAGGSVPRDSPVLVDDFGQG